MKNGGGGISRALTVSVLESISDSQEHASYVDVFDMVINPAQIPLLRADMNAIV
jgi:hypothetical protein